MFRLDLRDDQDHGTTKLPLLTLPADIGEEMVTFGHVEADLKNSMLVCWCNHHMRPRA